jgi:predicted short-subunit dehydrogenase-like oxidoreductase (DUF2520 family)
VTTLRLVGPGRAGRSLASALVDSGLDLRGVLHRGDDLSGAADGVDVVVIATPDAAVAPVAAAIAPVDTTVVLHLSGALGLDVLAPHRRRASLHPLVPLPSAEVGRVRLRSGVTFAVAGDPMAATLGRLLGGRCVEIDDDGRAAAAVQDVSDLGAAAALTGPAARGDEATLDRHRAALAPDERAGYDAGVALARRLARSEVASCA